MRYEKRANRAALFGVLVSSTMLKKVLFGGIGFSVLLQPSMLQAQIASDPNAGISNRPDIVAAPNGVPSIDIVTPNGKGLSHNKYYDFNIGNPGVIFNNHAQEVGQSQLGGIMPGNPHLRSTGSATVILNEVTSSKRSALNGPAEVFGRQADVIIANPNGISCDGCGFINTPHATLTTGLPEIDASGFLKGFEVRGGDISFGAKGANFFSGKGAVDIVDIVSRTVHFEGAVAGREIGVSAGTGHFDYASRQMKELTDITGKPEYAIDGSALGALQADRIKLVATEQGVGVRMRHDMAANVGQLQLSADGKISLKNVFGHGGVVLQSKSKSVLAKSVTSKKHIEIAAKKDVTLEMVGADGDLKVDAQDGLLSISGKATSGGNMQLSSRQTLHVAGLGSGADMALEVGGDLNIEGIVLAEGSLKAHAGGDIQAGLLAGGVDMAATGAAGVVVLGAQGDVDLESVGGSINATNIYGAGDVTLVSHDGLFVSQLILSHQNVAIHAQPETNASVHFGQVLAYGKANIDGGAVDFASLITGDDAVLTVGSLDAGTLMTGLDFVSSQVSPSNPSGALVFYDKGSLSITAQRGIKVEHIISGGNIDLFAGNDIYYDQVMGYGTATLTSVSGGISVENELSVCGDVRLTATTLDLSNDRSHIYTPQTLFLNGDHIYVSGSTLIYGGLDFNSTNVLDIHHARLQAITDEGGSGNILFVAPGVMVDETTSVLAARDFVIKTGRLENSGQLASGQDLAFMVTGDVSNSKTGLIYVKGNGALQVDGTVLNDFGAIMAEGDLFFTNAAGSGKSLSLVNKAGFIQAGGNLNIQTNTLKNEADSTPEITEKTEEIAIAFEKPEGSDRLSDGMLYQDGPNQWGTGHEHQSHTGPFKGHVKIFLDVPFWASKEETYGTAISSDGTVYKAFSWEFKPVYDQKSVKRYQWNGSRWKGGFFESINENWSHMTEKTVTQAFSHKPTVQGMIESHGNLIINADSIDNHYSIIRAEGNADIQANMLTNLGATAYKNTYMGCDANTDAYCYGYKADGSRDVSLDIANGAVRHIRSEALESVPGLVQAGGTLNLVVDQLHNTAAEGSITGDAHFEAKTVGGDPLGALSGLTGAGALFTPNIALDGTAGVLDGSSLPLPKPQSGGVGGTLPNQNFLYETRAEFLDVGKFYGSAYYLNRIGYKPDREIFFLGDAYFEKQLIEKQMRDLVGQGLGKGSFIPGSDAIEQVKTLLDIGAEYAKAHNLPFGEALSEEQLASLEAPMVIYVRQQVKGMDVYAPVLYIPEKDRASFVSAGALIMGDDVNITSQNTSNSTINNSGRIAANHQLYVHGGDILSQGGHFAAGGDAVLLAENNIRLDAGRTTVDGVETVLNTNALSTGGNATVIAKQDITASGVGITTGGDLTMATEQGDLTIGSAETHHHSENSDATMHHKSQVHSGGSMTFVSGKDLNVLGSDVQAKESLHLQAEKNISIDATRNSANSYHGDQTSHVALHNGSHLSSGKETTVISGQDIHMAASYIDAKGNVALGAQGEIAIGVRNDEMEDHLHTNNTKADMQVSVSQGSSIKSGGDTTVVAGQDGKKHDLTITGSSVAAEKKVGLKASNDIVITNAEDSLHYEMSYHKDGGTFSSSKSVHNKIDTTKVVGSSVTGGEGVAIDSGNDTAIIGSMVLAGKGKEAPEDQKQADISIHSGGKIVIKGAQEQFDQQQQSSSSSLLHDESSDKSESHTTTVSSVLGATGNIDMEAQGDAKISASHLLSGQDINVSAEDVTIDGMTDHHSSHSEEHESGFGVGSGKGFVSIYGSEGKTQNEESFEHQGSSLNADGTINITATKKDVTIVGSDVAGENVNLTAARDVNVLVGQNSHQSSSKEEREGFGIQFEKSSSSASVGVGIASAKDTGDQKETTSVQSHITAKNDVQITAGNDVTMQAADVLADRDLNIDAGNTITLSESHDISNTQETHEKSFAGVTTTVNVGVLDTVQGLKDSADHMNNKDGNNTVINGVLTGMKINHLFNKGRNFVSWLTGNTGERGNISKGLSSSLGGLGRATKDALTNMADASASVTVGFKTEKAEASSQTSTAVTGTMEAGRSVNMQAHKGSIHGVGADIIAGTNPVYANDEKSGNINLEAGKDITLESAQNTQSTQNRSESASVNVGTSYGTGGAGGTGNASFSQGEGSSEEVHQKNAHISGTGTVHTNSGGDTTLAGAVVSGDHVEMNVGGDLTITSRSDTGQTSNKQKSASVGFGGSKSFDAGSTSFSLQKDQSSSDYHSVVEQSGVKAGDGGFKINVKDKTTMTGGLIASTASPDKNSLTTGSISTSDITNSAHAQASSHGVSVSGNDTIKNIAKNALSHGKAKDGAEGETKSAISDGTIILTDATNQRAMGQDAGQIIDTLNRNTAAAHQAVVPLDATPLEEALHNRLNMINDLSDEGFGYWGKVREIANVKEHPEGEVLHDENGNVIYATDKNGQYITDSNDKKIPLYHYLTPEEEKHLQKGSDGNRRMFYNGIFNTPDEAARNAVQLADNKNEPLYFTYHPKADSWEVEVGVAIYEYFGGWSNSTKKFQDFIYRYGNKGAIVDAHSRAGSTVGNGLHDFEKRGIHGIGQKTDIYLFGPAYNSLSMANTVYIVSDGKKDHVYLQNHLLDPIGTGFGGNPPTTYKVPFNPFYLLFPPALPLREQGGAIFGSDPSTHNCYGNASKECIGRYGTAHTLPIYSVYSILDNLDLGYLWRKK
ncbi:filamentous hemagglutinin family domain-containing protein [Bartonella vinsonii subsp. arupensis Pm136co]|uniref:Filamentous hemagglutinin family domain-containing protein n=1 Tax=Bartonella vinsonii subsp. arupensis Pm136co TaxID=1094561 RepID=A0ABN0GNG7_BARVI|nr:hemagglutinin repeat-containing protein [Bartonella vinsonii]EJF96781.1 filamentous hemagglutinin family domain-containing protein [Bartonella vinsonii subsp. arupensis Pm136co]